MTFRVIRFSSCCLSRLLLLLMLWVLVNMHFPSSHRVMAFVRSHQRFPATCFLGESSRTTTTAQKQSHSLLIKNGLFHEQHQHLFSRTFYTFPTKTATSNRLFAFPQQSRSNHNDDSVPKDIYIPEDQLDFSFVRSSGAGGQNVNKVSSAVCLKLDLSPSSTSCQWIPNDVRERLIQQQSSRINKAGVLTLNVQEHRTQVANRRAAVQRLKQMILLAWKEPKVREMKTGLSQLTKDRRKEDKRKRGQVKENRRPVDW